MSNDQKIEFLVNGCKYRTHPKAHSSLLVYLRNELKLTGTKLGCATGNCGACSVLIDGLAVQSCQVSVSAAANCEINTVEGIVQTPLGDQIASTLTRHDAAQCGYCLPGIVVVAYAALLNTDKPDPVDALQRNLCRCGTHSRILVSLQEVIRSQDRTK